MAERNYFINGITELLILSFLKNHDAYVYEITKSIEEKSGGLLSISQNTIYTATYKLENEGKISEYSKLVGRKRTRIYYHIEDEGINYLEQLSNNYNNTINGVKTILDSLKLYNLWLSEIKQPSKIRNISIFWRLFFTLLFRECESFSVN